MTFRSLPVTGRLLAALVLAAILAGCSVSRIVPAYDHNLADALARAHTDVFRITACVELGLCASAESFVEQRENYIGAMSSLGTARALAGNLDAPSETARGARDELESFIVGCAAQLQALAGLHRAGRALPGIGLTQPVETACDQALRAAQAMQ
jgi:hypothetical protein